MYYVVVRNDLDPDQVGYVPTQTVKRTLEQSGYQRVTGFGPVVTGGRMAHHAPLQVEGLYPRERAVEIYEPASNGATRPGQAGLSAIADTAVVSGGPEALLPLAADPSMRGRPAVLTGDNHPGLGTAAVQALGDGLRRADTRFGLVNSNTSYTYTPDQRNDSDSAQDACKKPHQILPTKGIQHQTVAELRGARSVTASSTGNWLFHLPQYDPGERLRRQPRHRVDGGRVRFRERAVAADPLRGVPGTCRSPSRSPRCRRTACWSAATRVRLETEKGSATSYLEPDGMTQSVKAPVGSTSWMKLTIVGSTASAPA